MQDSIVNNEKISRQRAEDPTELCKRKDKRQQASQQLYMNKHE